MDGLVSTNVTTHEACSNGNVVLGTKRLYNGKDEKHGGVVEHKCRFVNQ